MAEELGYFLPDQHRHLLQSPFGTILQTDGVPEALSGFDRIYAIGDVVSRTLQDLGIEPAIFVCDFRTRRGDIDPELQAKLGSWGTSVHRLVNPPGLITEAANQCIQALLAADATGPVRIEVEGEEDLLGLIFFCHAPLGSNVVYGAPGKGLVVNPITEEHRAHARRIWSHLEARPIR